jgi:hypothetical protein
MTEREIGRFYAEGETGTMYTVIEYEEIAVSSPLRGGRKLLGGARRLALADGRHVNPVEGDPAAFEIFDTEEVIRKR